MFAQIFWQMCGMLSYKMLCRISTKKKARNSRRSGRFCCDPVIWGDLGDKELIKYKNVHLYLNKLEGNWMGHYAVEDAAVFGKPEASVQKLVTALVVKKTESEKPCRRVGIADRKVFARPESFCACQQNWLKINSKHSISLEDFQTV